MPKTTDGVPLHIYEGGKTVQVHVSLIAYDCLRKLLLTGLYGASIEEVVQRLIEERLRTMLDPKTGKI
jgi:hypothetical protein